MTWRLPIPARTVQSPRPLAHETAITMPLTLNTALPAGLEAAPHFMPDATHGTVRATGADDLERADIRIVMTNSFHLMMRPGISAVRSLGGAKAFLGWNKVLATDSGGFQAYS